MGKQWRCADQRVTPHWREMSNVTIMDVSATVSARIAPHAAFADLVALVVMEIVVAQHSVSAHLAAFSAPAKFVFPVVLDQCAGQIQSTMSAPRWQNTGFPWWLKAPQWW